MDESMNWVLHLLQLHNVRNRHTLHHESHLIIHTFILSGANIFYSWPIYKDTFSLPKTSVSICLPMTWDCLSAQGVVAIVTFIAHLDWFSTGTGTRTARWILMAQFAFEFIAVIIALKTDITYTYPQNLHSYCLVVWSTLFIASMINGL